MNQKTKLQIELIQTQIDLLLVHLEKEMDELEAKSKKLRWPVRIILILFIIFSFIGLVANLIYYKNVFVSIGTAAGCSWSMLKFLDLWKHERESDRIFSQRLKETKERLRNKEEAELLEKTKHLQNKIIN